MHLVWPPIRLAILALFGAVLLQSAAVAGNPVTRNEEVPPPVLSVLTAPGGRAHSGATDSDYRLASRWVLRWRKHPLAFYKIVRGDDPNDDETSDDPNDDDDAWDDVTSWYDDSDVPIVAWRPGGLPHTHTPGRLSAPWTAPPNPPILTGQRLRC
jgi:hypothetical protein